MWILICFNYWTKKLWILLFNVTLVNLWNILVWSLPSIEHDFTKVSLSISCNLRNPYFFDSITRSIVTTDLSIRTLLCWLWRIREIAVLSWFLFPNISHFHVWSGNVNLLCRVNNAVCPIIFVSCGLQLSCEINFHLSELLWFYFWLKINYNIVRII